MSSDTLYYFNTAAIGRPTAATREYLRLYHAAVYGFGPRSAEVLEFIEEGSSGNGVLATSSAHLAQWDGLGPLAGRLRRLGGFPDDTSVVLTQGTSAALQLVLSACDGLDVVGLTDLEHESELVVARNVVKTRPELVSIRRLLNRDDAVERIVDAVATAGRRLDVVILSHVTAAEGYVLPIRKIIRALRDSCPHLRVIVDGAHGIGHVPVNLAGAYPDAYICSGHKWLQGPTTSGFALLPVGSEIAATRTLQEFLVAGILLEGASSTERIHWGPATLDCGAVTGLGVELLQHSTEARTRAFQNGRENRDHFEQCLREGEVQAVLEDGVILDRGNVSLVKIPRHETVLSKALARRLEREHHVVTEGVGLGAVRFSFTGKEKADDLMAAASAVAGLTTR